MPCPLSDAIFQASCSLLACSSRELGPRVEQLLNQLQREGMADYLWILTHGYGEHAPSSADQQWRSSRTPRARSALRTWVKRRCLGHGRESPLRCRSLSGGELELMPLPAGSSAMVIPCSPCAAVVLGWELPNDEEDAAFREALPALCCLAAAIAQRFQRERVQQVQGESSRDRGAAAKSSSAMMSPISLPTAMSSAMMAAVGFNEHTSVASAPQMGEAELWRAYALFELINRGSEDMITIHDAKGNCIYVNDAYMALLGYQPADLIGKTVFDISNPEDHSALREAFESMIDHGVSHTFECRLRDAGNHWRWMEVRGGVVLDEQGQFTEMVLMLRDITERRDFEQTLSFNEHNLRAMLDNVPDAAWLKDAAGCFLLANPAAARLFGAEADELVGRSEGEFLGIADAHRSSEYDQLLMLSGDSVSYTHHLGRDGCDEAILEVRKEPVIDDNGEIIAISCFAQDVTRLVRIQLDLIRATLLMNHTEAVAGIGLWSIQARGEELYWNDGMFSMCGLPRGAFQPSLETFLQLIQENQRAATAAAIEECFQLRRPFRIDVVVQRPDGSSLPAVLVGAPFHNGHGQLAEIAGVMVPVHAASSAVASSAEEV
ncbi:MAG: PAS domain S-box protein [Planctomycetota bacterium]|nr:MAG: PAS domain S-box protein [Planctomycetota bacterium]